MLRTWRRGGGESFKDRKHQMQMLALCTSQHASPEGDLVCKYPKFTQIILHSYVSCCHKYLLGKISSKIPKGADDLCLIRQLLRFLPLILEPLWVIQIGVVHVILMLKMHLHKIIKENFFPPNHSWDYSVTLCYEIQIQVSQLQISELWCITQTSGRNVMVALGI